MYCKHCGKEIAGDSKFCKFCGKSLEGNSINYMESIKAFISSNKKIVWIVLGLLFCVCIGWIWYINTPSHRIVGEWQREIAIGTEVEIFNSDGTFESKTLSPGFGDVSTKGKWSISGKTLTRSFWWEGEEYTDNYIIVKLNSDEFVFMHEKEGREKHYKRKTDQQY